MLSKPSLIALFAFLGTLAHSDGHLRLDCSGLDPEKDGDADLAFLCLEDYQQRLEELEIKMSKLIDANSNEPFAPDIPDGMPSGLIAAFDLSGGCPNGWSPFAEGQGRMIVGASFGIDDNLFRDEELTQRKYRDHGGEEEVTLTVRQMPQHTHKLTGHMAKDNQIGGSNHFYDIRGEAPRRNDDVGLIVSSTGGSQPHNNMPPYIALYFCKKD